MPRVAAVPADLRYKPFRGSAAIRAGLITARQLTGPAWTRLYRDVYISAGVPVDLAVRCQAAALLLPAGAALSHDSAALLHNTFIAPLGSTRVHVSIPPRARMPRDDGLVVHRVLLEPTEIVRRCAVPVTRPARIAFDLGRSLEPVEAVVALDALLYQRVIRPDDLGAIADARTGWSGVDRFRRAARLARPHVESPMETRMRLRLVEGGLAEPTVQYTVLDSRGLFVARLDLAYERFRIGLEYDGDHHRERDTFRQDAARLNRLRLLGWTILRFTAADVLRFPERLVAQVSAALMIATNVRLHT
jgi:very-short-patch-repair endonuclease